MKTIKTRSAVKGIKVLDKSVNLSTRMKDSFVRTKERAEETQKSHYASPTEYATGSIEDKAQGAAQSAASDTVHHFHNPRQKARDNIERAKGHFQDAKNQMPQARRRTAEQAQKTAGQAKTNAGKLKNTADQSQRTAQEAKAAVGDAKQTLREVRQKGRETLREVKQRARTGSENPVRDRFIRSRQNKPRMTPKGEIPNTGVSEMIPGNGVKPNYMSSGTKAVKNADNTLKSAKSATKGVKETAKGTIKTAKKSVKTAEQTAKAAVKTAQRTAKTAQKTAQAAAKAAKIAEKAARATAKAAAHAAKAAVKAVTAMVKAAIAAIKGLVTAIAAGGWIAVVVILLICLIGLIVASIFGIFFSSEPDTASGKSVNSVISEINTEYTDKIDGIINANTHDLLDMSGARAAWKQVLAVYTVKTVADPDNPMEVATMIDEKAEILRTVFWDMNTITHTTSTTTVEVDVLGDDGLPTGETTDESKTVLRITVSHKTTDEMAALYGFTDEQKEWLAELLKPDYHNLWNGLLYGITSIGDGSMIEIADTQIGNVGGEPYWSWYGFDSRVEWCACFVSWCAEQCGYIDAGVIPRFSGCSNGVQWFKDRKQWQDSGYTPAPGDIIFFDWEPDGTCDHVGIVEYVADDVVHTIEGNTSDSCARRSYALDSSKIVGYGVPQY